MPVTNVYYRIITILFLYLKTKVVCCFYVNKEFMDQEEGGSNRGASRDVYRNIEVNIEKCRI